ncbi:bifunctional 1-(5-phosphoribosyl)-5-((5-phosphoribosylamino)methylideneamino)imidazole-4-carboxamide isomerase/phosphoribosylanthranilate isomerase PriA [Actinokineospora bangkokensis]|uniref:1-(5-phosphoribosyl)-5-[(5-phosphoribosylamino)methylideneamino] imidazole-4-carboxamide isomerase n=1 Tax=Actinokineospora bangkokensis TaxID=1193682 RepID=A0A1Q9LQD5_9PSEU|nr:bifunctional 1-(5-phosphoribosyl)-5-((5-phosphoribosylamino)methylideneamino)imidazole-4-carboxamide isomerase/phosphoribosylanthranilate isomerase PriA [Actinokineospora bangkokensis]OLR94239.1 bifunctional 1-(5-phosphoribosyl)-5-((5-phosphoribosylamino)methylideneamino)imidazole-4-carboxamide isomerase/phosphoribosylanthranilate isomerase PriA [Actinokineospora bangkokensis]
MSFYLLPAVDISDGKAVRLHQGEAGTETVYGTPLDAALAWQAAGAEWVHVVDLDAAFGTGDNRAITAEIAGTLDVKVELAGGIRDDATLAAALATGCARVNIGTAALENPDWCRRVLADHGDRIAIDLAVKGTPGSYRLATRGWTTEAGDPWETLTRLDADGCPRYVVTDVSKDGTLAGPNIPLLREFAARTTGAIVASGGVSSVADLEALAALEPEGIEAAIIGKALYNGNFALEDALAAVR